MNRDGIMERVEKFVALAQAIINEHYGIQFANIDVPQLVIGGGKKYLQIISESIGGSAVRPEKRRSIFCFIDLTTGDLLKPATFKAPAKHARGNLFDDDYAIRNIGPYGVAYMDGKRNILTPLGKVQSNGEATSGD